jgi:hypothetical protein
MLFGAIPIDQSETSIFDLSGCSAESGPQNRLESESHSLSIIGIANSFSTAFPLRPLDCQNHLFISDATSWEAHSRETPPDRIRIPQRTYWECPRFLKDALAGNSDANRRAYRLRYAVFLFEARDRFLLFLFVV